MNMKQKMNWWIDASLFVGLIICFYLDLTGVSLHQWLGIFGGVLAVYHLITHWSWVTAVSQRFFGHTSLKARLYYVIDALVFSGLAVIVGTGLVISTWLNLSLTNYTGWLSLHITASIVTLCLMVLKLSLHWRWIVSATRSVFAPLPQPQLQRGLAPIQSVPVPVRVNSRQMSRAEFLKVIGVVGVTSILALTSAGASLKLLEDSETSASAQEQTSTSSQSVSSSSAASSSTCSIRCNRRCSFPGNCRKYTDSNNNGRCDLGEYA